MNKIIFFLAMALMILSVANSYAQTKPEDTDNDGYYNISTLDELRWISENDSSWSWNFELDCDIDASKTRWWNWGKGWSPIGNEEKPFTGNFNGKNHSIKNIFMKRKRVKTEKHGTNNKLHIGFFGYIDSKYSVISNLFLKDLNYTGGFYTAGLIAIAKGCRVVNCKVTGHIKSNYGVSGFIFSGDSLTIENCRTKVNLSGEWVCGFAHSLSNSEIMQSATTSTITFSNEAYGFCLLAYNSEISECFTMNLYRKNKPKLREGLYLETDCCYFFISRSGYGKNRPNAIRNCFAISTLEEKFHKRFKKKELSYVGYISGTINDCYSVVYSKDNFDGINNFFNAKNKHYSNINDCFYNEIIFMDSIEKSKPTEIIMKSKQTYIDAGWDFENIWDIDPNKNDGYPFLRNVPLGLVPLYVDIFLEVIMGRLEDVSNMYRGQLASTVRYSESFKKQVVSEVESGKLNKDAAKRKYNIGGSTTVLKWCRKYGKNSTETSDPTELLIMKNKVSEAAYKKRIAELEQELSFSKLKSNYLECVITELEIAGGVSAKKSVRTPLLDAKQSSPNLK